MKSKGNTKKSVKTAKPIKKKGTKKVKRIGAGKNIFFLAFALVLGIAIGLSTKEEGIASGGNKEVSTWNPSAILNDGNTPQAHFPIATPVIQHRGYTLGYDSRNRNPCWVMEVLTKESLKGNADRVDCQFKEDGAIPIHLQAKLEDYRSSGYDRGHLAPASDFKSSPEAMEDSFFLSNMCPQEPQFNRGYWKKLENYVKDLTLGSKIVKVITGPLYIPQKEKNGLRYVKYRVIGENNVAVPTHFFKVILSEKLSGSIDAQAYILPNQAIAQEVPLEKFKTTIQQVEKVSGLIFAQITSH